MPDQASRPRPAAFSWRPYLIAIIPIAIYMAIPAVKHKESEWTTVFVKAANLLLKGESIFWYDGYVYPPFPALLAIPFTILPPLLSRSIFYLISLACLFLIVRLSWDLSGGCSTSTTNNTPKSEHTIFLLACAAAIRFSFNALSHLQTDLLIYALIALGCLAAVYRRFTWSAIAWGLATAFKGPPLIMIVYLIWRKRFLDAILMLAVAVCVNLLPNFISTPPQGGLWLTQWIHDYAKPFGRNDVVGKWYNDPLNNQSIAGEINRFLLFTPHATSTGVKLTPRPEPPNPQTLKGILILSDAFVLLFTAIIFFRRRGPYDPPDAPIFLRRDILEMSMLLMLMLLISPMSSRSHYPIALLPAFCLARHAVYTRSRLSWTLLILAILGSLLSFNNPINKNIGEFAMYSGAVMISALCLFLGCAYLILQRQQEPQTIASPQLSIQ